MDNPEKSDKELAVEAAVGYVQSWNAVCQVRRDQAPIDSKRFADILKGFYQEIKNLDQS